MPLEQPDIFAAGQRRHEAALIREDRAAELFQAGRSSTEVAHAMGVNRQTAQIWRRRYEKRAGVKLGRPKLKPPVTRKRVRADGDPLTVGQRAVADLCDGTLTMSEIGARLGLDYDAVASRRQSARRCLGRDLPVRFEESISLTGETLSRSRAMDEKLAAAETCARCGLRMFWGREVHEREGCIGRAADYASSGTSNLGAAQRG